MSHFYATIDNGHAKTLATRRGFKTHGITAHVHGWDFGVRVEARHVEGHDVILVYRTGGSNNPEVKSQVAIETA